MLITAIGTETNGGVAWLDAPAAASWDRMAAAGMPTDGITDSGRPSSAQVVLFLARYTTNYAASGRTDRRVWQGRTYWRKRGVASAATPGTSNHETGNALDLAGATLAWVRAHGAAYGWIADRVAHEPWHVEYVATRDTEAKTVTPTVPATPTAPLPPSEEDDMIPLIERTYRDLCDRTASLDEIAGWHDSTRGWSAARFLTAFRANKAEAGSVRAAYRALLHREAGASEVASQLTHGYSIGALFDAVARAHAAGAR